MTDSKPTVYIPQTRIYEICEGGVNSFIPALSAAQKGRSVMLDGKYYVLPDGVTLDEGMCPAGHGEFEMGLSAASVKAMFQSGMVQPVGARGVLHPKMMAFERDFGISVDDLRCAVDGQDHATSGFTSSISQQPMTPDALRALFNAQQRKGRG